MDLPAAEAAGLYRPVDARLALSTFMVDGWPNRELFEQLTERLLGDVQHARVFGEMVALLVGDGLADAALALEALWNQAVQRRTFSLLCAYPLAPITGESMAPFVENACLSHQSVVPAESYSRLETRGERMREIVALQRKAAQLEMALAAERAARDAAEAALRVRDEFLSTASHELRTPITVLGVQAQLMVRRWERSGELETERALRALRTIGNQADKLGRLVNQLLDVSRLHSGRLRIEPVGTDLPPLIEQVVAVSQGLSDQHPISVDAPEHLEWSVDPLRLEQVLMNLFDNAMKYSPDGAPIQVTLTKKDAGDLELSVRDFGPGIEPDKRDHIFDRFYQANDGYARTGLGLGLYLSRNIIELHGGELVAEFPPDGGTRFVVRLPG
jgi:signal transduction histidine kinase